VRILVVAATGAELTPFLARLQQSPTGEAPGVDARTIGTHAIDILVTGVGMVATAARVAGVLATQRCDLALNLGVCGSFDRTLLPGAVVHVVEDTIPELGAEDGDGFLTVQELGLLDAHEFPFRGGALVNADPPANAALARLPRVRGITVNTVHGHDESIARVRARLQPQVESMEGAAFMYACLLHHVPFAQVRAVSNMVERRNRAAWRLDEAMARLGETAADLLEHACN
jgi:futalosine hydrolase